MTDPTEIEDTPYTVVVGVSATSGSPTALLWARDQARANDGRLIAVRVYKEPSVQQAPPGTASRNAPSIEQLQAEQQARLEGDVAAVLGEDHDAEVRVVRGRKRRGLLNAARGADLLVIDAPRTPSMSPLLAQRIVASATCPVVVMPPAISGLPESALSRSAQALGRAALRSAGTSGSPGFRPPGAPH